MPYNTNTLPDVNGIAGDFSIEIEYDDSLGTVTFPTVQTIKNIGDLESMFDREAGKVQVDSLQLDIVEDYTTYTEGFWYKILNAALPPRIYIDIDEGSGAEFYYYGEVDALTIQWDEQYISSTYVRTSNFEIVSFLKSFEQTATSDWLDDAETRATTITPDLGTSLILKVTDMIASLLYVSGLNGTWSGSQVNFIWDSTTQDLKFQEGVNDYHFGEIYICLNSDVGGGGTLVDYWNSGAANYLGNLYQTADLLLYDICKTFALVPVLRHDGSNFILDLYQKGHAYASATTLDGGIIESRIVRDFNVTNFGVYVFAKLDETDITWASRELGTGTTTPNEGVEFDIRFPVIWVINENSQGEKLFFYDGTLALIDDIEYWNYTTGSYSAVGASLKMQSALSQYEFYRYLKQKKAIERVYSSLLAGGSQANITLFRKGSINDGVSTQTYFLNRFVKSAENNTVEIQWVQI